MTKIKSLIYNTGPGAGGSGCRRLFFFILIHPNKACKIDWEIRAIFIINLHSKDSAPLAAGELELIKSSLGVGRISKQGKDSLQYLVTSVKELEVIIDHFDKYPLITQKWSDYELFKQALLIIKNKEHLTMEGSAAQKN